MKDDINDNRHTRGNIREAFRRLLDFSDRKVISLRRNKFDFMTHIALVNKFERNLVDSVDLIVREENDSWLSCKR